MKEPSSHAAALGQVRTQELERALALLKGQKAEAVAQVAAAIAHDFNNLLTVINGHASLLLATEQLSPKGAESLKEVVEAGKRASALTRQLLIFSRECEVAALPQEAPPPAGASEGEAVQLILTAQGAETILVVENEVPLLKLMRHILENHGHKVLEATNGREAQAVWEAHRHEIGLLVTDLILPGGMAGTEVARRLQQAKPSLKVLYTSGYDSERVARELPPGTEVRWLQKPFHARRLTELVEEMLGKLKTED